MTEGPKHPHVTVRLTGEDGNVFAIMGRVLRRMRQFGLPKEEREAFIKEVTASRSYDEALRVVLRWVTVE